MGNQDRQTQQLKAQLQRIQDWIEKDFADINSCLDNATCELDKIKTELDQYHQKPPNHEATST